MAEPKNLHIDPTSLQNTMPAPPKKTAAPQHTHINFKVETQDIKPDLILWIKFFDNNERTFKNISYQYTLAQMYFGKTPIVASLKHVWDAYHKLLDVDFKGKFRVARIYGSRSKGADDFIVQYTSNGEVEYRSNGLRIEQCRINFDSSTVIEHEKKLVVDMQLRIQFLKDKYVKTSN